MLPTRQSRKELLDNCALYYKGAAELRRDKSRWDYADDDKHPVAAAPTRATIPVPQCMKFAVRTICTIRQQCSLPGGLKPSALRLYSFCGRCDATSLDDDGFVWLICRTHARRYWACRFSLAADRTSACLNFPIVVQPLHLVTQYAYEDTVGALAADACAVLAVDVCEHILAWGLHSLVQASVVNTLELPPSVIRKRKAPLYALAPLAGDPLLTTDVDQALHGAACVRSNVPLMYQWALKTLLKRSAPI